MDPTPVSAASLSQEGLVFVYKNGQPQANQSRCSQETKRKFAAELTRRHDLFVAGTTDRTPPHRVRIGPVPDRFHGYGVCECCGDGFAVYARMSDGSTKRIDQPHRAGTCMLCVAAIRRALRTLRARGVVVGI